MAKIDGNRQWGFAWVAMVAAIALHVADEAMNDFLPLYNSTVASIREAVAWFPMPTLDFRSWLTGLSFGIILLFALSPLAFSGNRYFRPVSYFMGVFMILNALGHTAVSIYLGYVAPGTLSSPVLFIAAVALLVTTARTGRNKSEY